MLVPVKVVMQIRRTGTNANNLRTTLENNRTQFTTDCAASLLTLEPTAAFSWSMRAYARGGNVYHLYPKVEADLPNTATYEDLWPRMRAIRDAVVTRLQSIAASSNWTIQNIHTKNYGGS